MKLPLGKYLKIVRKFEIVISSLVIIIFVLLLSFKLLLPNILKVKEINADKNELKEKLPLLTNKNDILSTVDERLLSENFAKLNYVVPESKDYVLLFTALDSLQDRLGIQITRTDFQLGPISTSSAKFAAKREGDTYLLPINLEVIGSYDQVENFIIALSDLSGRLITANQIKLELTDFGLIQVVVYGNTYYNPLPKTIGQIDTPIPEFSQSNKQIFNRILEKQYPVKVIEESQQEVPVGKKNLFL